MNLEWSCVCLKETPKRLEKEPWQPEDAGGFVWAGDSPVCVVFIQPLHCQIILSKNVGSAPSSVSGARWKWFASESEQLCLLEKQFINLFWHLLV